MSLDSTGERLTRANAVQSQALMYIIHTHADLTGARLTVDEGECYNICNERNSTRGVRVSLSNHSCSSEKLKIHGKRLSSYS